MTRPRLLLGCLLLAGCSTASPKPPAPAPTPQQQTLARAIDAVHAGLEESDEAARSQSSYEVDLRLNLCSCEAPGFEVGVFGTWSRAYLRSSQEFTELALAQFEEASAQAPLARLRVRGRWADESRMSATKVLWPIFEILEVMPQPQEQEGPLEGTPAAPQAPQRPEPVPSEPPQTSPPPQHLRNDARAPLPVPK